MKQNERWPRRPALCLALFILVGIGCGKGDDPYSRVGFAGTVELDGAPVEFASIMLEPLERQPTQGFGYIQQGKFNVPPSSGVVPGEYRVVIVLDDPGESDSTSQAEEPMSPKKPATASKFKQLPAIYNSKSTLKAVLKSGEPNDQLHFSLSMTPKK